MLCIEFKRKEKNYPKEKKNFSLLSQKKKKKSFLLFCWVFIRVGPWLVMAVWYGVGLIAFLLPPVPGPFLYLFGLHPADSIFTSILKLKTKN